MFKPFTLIDVNQIPDEECLKHKWAALFELLQKHSRERDMLPFLEKLFKGELKLKLDDYGDFLYLMVKYVTGPVEVRDRQKFVDLLKHALPEGEKKMTTLAQDWKNEGGHEKAMVIAQNMLKVKEGSNVNFIKRVTGLPEEELQSLASHSRFSKK